MSSIISQLLHSEYLRRLQLLFAIYIVRILHGIELSYQRSIKNITKQLKDGKTSSSSSLSSSNLRQLPLQLPLPPPTRITTSTSSLRLKRSINISLDDECCWNWQGLPEIHWTLVVWDYFSNLFYVYIIVRNLGSDFIEAKILEPLGLMPDVPLRCYLTGRYCLFNYELVDEILCVAVAMMHLIWRMYQKMHKQEMTIEYILFFTEQDLLRYYRKHSIDCNNHFQCQLRDSVVVRFFKEIMSYRVLDEANQNHSYRLRPNRGQEASARLRLWFSVGNIILIILTIMIATPLIPFISLKRLSRDYYAEYMPKCNVQLYWVSIENLPHIDINWYRLYIYSFDFMENLIIWAEFLLAFAVAMQLITFLQIDLMVYWKSVHEDVIRLYTFLRDYQEATMVKKFDSHGRFFMIPMIEFKSTSFTMRRTSSLINNNDIRKYKLNTKDDITLRSAALRNIEQLNQLDRLDQTMHELQFKMHDFFRQIKRADCFISDVLSLIMFVWFSVSVVYIYTSMTGGLQINAFGFLIGHSGESQHHNHNHHHHQQQDNLGNSPYFLLLIFVPMIAITIIGWSLLTLHQHCMLTYRYLCPLLAMYQSGKKRSFLAVLDYFRDRRTCYTLFRLNPFLPTTYMSFIGWTFSCFFILRSLLDFKMALGVR